MCDLPLQTPFSLPVIGSPTSEVKAHSSPSPHLPRISNGPPHVSLMSLPHTWQHPHTSRIVPRGQSVGGSGHALRLHGVHFNASTPAWLMHITKRMRDSANTCFTIPITSRRQSPAPLRGEERIPTLHLGTFELQRKSPTSNFLYPADNTKNKRST